MMQAENKGTYTWADAIPITGDVKLARPGRGSELIPG